MTPQRAVRPRASDPMVLDWPHLDGTAELVCRARARHVDGIFQGGGFDDHAAGHQVLRLGVRAVGDHALVAPYRRPRVVERGSGIAPPLPGQLIGPAIPLLDVGLKLRGRQIVPRDSAPTEDQHELAPQGVFLASRFRHHGLHRIRRRPDRRGLVARVVSLARKVVRQRTELADMGERIRDHLLIDDSDRFGREDGFRASGPASVVLWWSGRRVGAWVPAWPANRLTPFGLSCESICRPGPRFCGTHRQHRPDLPVLCKRPGFTGPAASGCVPSLNHRKGTAMTIVEDKRAITGGVDTHADMHVAAALDPIGGLLGVQEFPATTAGYAGLLGW